MWSTSDNHWYILVCSGVKALKDEATLDKIGVVDGGVLYFKDLGTQIGWTKVITLAMSRK